MYNKKPDGRFECVNLREYYEADMAKYTKDYMRMSERERQIFDYQKQSKKDLQEIKSKFAKSNIADDLEKLK